MLDSLTQDFNFDQSPSKPLLLPTHPALVQRQVGLPSCTAPPGNLPGYLAC
jgi:hypothetical protein